MYPNLFIVEEHRIVHDLMIEEELRRHQPERRRGVRIVARPGPFDALRRVAGRGLVALAVRLDPTVEPNAAGAALQRA